MLETPLGPWNLGYGLIGALITVALYLASYGIRTFIAWTQREPGPKERVGFFILLAAAVGLIAGGLSHEPVEMILACQQTADPLVACLLGR